MNRVKSLSKSGNTKKDQGVNSLPPISKDASSAFSMPVSVDIEDVYEPQQEMKVSDTGRRVVEKETISYNPTVDYDKQQPSFSSGFNGREESGVASGSMDKERFEINNSYGGPTIQKTYPSYSQNSLETEVQKVSPPRRKGSRDTEKPEKLLNWPKKDGGGSESSTTNSRQQNTGNYNKNNAGSKQREPEPPSDGNINALLEVGHLHGNGSLLAID